LGKRVYLIVGLGNPGPEYRRHRHNAGFMVGEELTGRHALGALQNRFHGLVAEGQIAEAPVVLLLPLTYMNLSGKSVAEAARHYRVKAADILVIHDDVELPFGEVRLKEGQGLGGHNGLRSLEQYLGTRDFWRVRVGVGRPLREDVPLVDYVLAPFDEPEEEVKALISKAADLVEEWLRIRSCGNASSD